MKKILFIIIPSIILALVVFLAFQYFFNHASSKGALQVTSDPQSKIYLNGKYVGTTPLCLCGLNASGNKDKDKDMISSGDYSIKLDPGTKDLVPFEEKITISKSVLTVVDRKFGKSTLSEGSIISLSPLTDTNNIELQILTFPEGAKISLDSTSVGDGPILLNKDVTESDHALLIQKDGYKEKTIRIRTPKGYRLTAVVYLAVNGDDEVKKDDKKATPSAALTPVAASKRVRILQTPNGFLRVRQDASLSSAEITRVNSGEEFDVTDEASSWYKIKLPTGTEGWVSAGFVTEVKKTP